jgi:CheY-like chemotaxis protein
VADDNESNRELLSSLLTKEGYPVICVTDGQQALDQIAADSIDIALLDVLMPSKTGFDACLAIKSDPKTRLVPVLLLTSLNNDADRIRGIMCGADDFLSKPVTDITELAFPFSVRKPLRILSNFFGDWKRTAISRQLCFLGICRRFGRIQVNPSWHWPLCGH